VMKQIKWDAWTRLPEKDQRRTVLEKEVRQRLKTREGWRAWCNKSVPQDIKMCPFKEQRPTPHAPWIIPTNFLKIQDLDDRKRNEDQNDDEKRTWAERRILPLMDFYIYTDGSAEKGTTNGGGGIAIYDKDKTIQEEISIPTGSTCSSFDAETAAMKTALKWCQEKDNTRENKTEVQIFTDSLALVEALRSDSSKTKSCWLRDIREILMTFPSKLNITVSWIPAHCGFEGNDKADTLAKAGTRMSQENIPITKDAIKAKIKRETKHELTHDRAKATFKERRKPKEEEAKWPANIRITYSQLRTGHSLLLKHYRHRIQREETATCEWCEEEDQTIEHMLCRCPAIENQRTYFVEKTPTLAALVNNEPSLVKRLLGTKFPGLS
jgi:ribonuclease HI